MNLHSEMAASGAEAARVVCGVSSDQLPAATPCTDWDLRALLNHMILWTAYSAERRARDEQVPGELMNKDFVAEPGYAADYAAQLDKAVAAWSDPAAWQRNLNVMGAPTPAADVAALLIAEMVLHGWDAAKASGQEYACRDDVRPPFSARLRPTRAVPAVPGIRRPDPGSGIRVSARPGPRPVRA
jgi:uncharacterized protein (TIGR03086 family)